MSLLERLRLALEDLYVILFNPWLWIIILSCITIIVVPLIAMAIIVNLPPPMQAVATILIIIAWGIAGGYKEWSMHKRKEEKVVIKESE